MHQDPKLKMFHRLRLYIDFGFYGYLNINATCLENYLSICIIGALITSVAMNFTMLVFLCINFPSA